MLRQAQHKRIWGTAIALASACPAPATAQPATTNTRAIAAGYKALTLCSALFTAGRTQQQVEALELTGTYPEYDKLLPTLRATIDRTYGWVAVRYDADMLPRRAEWHPDTGCTILPPGAPPPPLVGDVRPLKTDFTPTAPDPRQWPLGDAGIAPRPSPALAQAIAAGFTLTGPRTTGALVVHDGKVVAERYADGFGPFVPNRTWSVAKSLAGTLVGAAIQQGAVKVADPANIPEWGGWPHADFRRTITLDHLLRMSSGLHSATAGNRTDAIYFGGTAVTEETVAWPIEVRPGTRFRYANNDILLAIRSLRATLGEDRYRFFPQTALFAPLGMKHTVAERDWRGNYILSSQVWTTARDLARFGQLYLNDGVWNGQRILPAGWAKYVATPRGPQPPEGPFGYGATFWLLNRSPGIPADTYAAIGNRGQYVVIVPSRRTVIVRRGEDAAGTSFDIAKFTAGVLAALR